MAWNEPGGNKQDPWGAGNKGRNQGPPDLDDAIRKFQSHLKKMFGGNGGSSGHKNNSGSYSRIFSIALVLVAIGYLWNAVYTVDEKELAVILRFGKYVETVGPGLHLYFPKIEEKFQERVTEYRTYNLHQQMLTEDENIVEVSMSVQYNISNIKDYILNIQTPLASLEEATQSALRHVVGSSEMHQVLTEGRETMGTDVRDRIQTYINSYGSGLSVRKVNIESAQPPKEVQSSFDDVIRAREDEERAKNNAEAYANKIVPEARGMAQRAIEEAHGYRDEIIARAEGEANRFIKLYSEYRKAPDITRERLYIETIENVFMNSNKVLVDVKGGNNMMYLPLDKLGNTKESSFPLTARDLSAHELKEITNRVTEELNKRVNSSRSASSGMVGR